MRLLIIRHGDPDYANDTLTKTGKKEAKLLAKRLKKTKIDYIYSSSMGRAKDTMSYTAKALKMQEKVIVKDCFREFNRFTPDRTIEFPTGETRRTAWDMLPAFWTEKEEFYDAEKWSEVDFYKKAELGKEYRAVAEGLDEVLANHGYVREGKIYKAVRPNTDTIAIFCHFGVEAVLLSHLFSLSPVPIWHNFIALPTSVTTLYTEERREGKASFRTTQFGSTEHLCVKGQTPSFSGRFCEIFTSEDRHD